MNQSALETFRKLAQRQEELEIFKEYLEHLYPYVNRDSMNQYLDDFLGIAGEIVLIMEELGNSNIRDYYSEQIKNVRISEDIFKDMMKDLYSLAVGYRNYYNESIRKCILCNEKIFYLPLPEEYEIKIRQYQGKKFRSETLNEKEYICPICGSLDRDRLIIAYLDQCNLLSEEDSSLLQIAPAKTIEVYLRKKYPDLRYDSADLYMKGVSYQVDLQNMNILSDESYSMWICSHVLEHIPDDRKALKELYRILKPNGIGILLVPLDLDMIETDEEIGCSEEENWRRFGQGDHVRKYAKQDFINKILECGFTLECLGKEYFGEQLFKENGLSDTATLYVVKK